MVKDSAKQQQRIVNQKEPKGENVILSQSGDQVMERELPEKARFAPSWIGSNF